MAKLLALRGVINHSGATLQRSEYDKKKTADL